MIPIALLRLGEMGIPRPLVLPLKITLGSDSVSEDIVNRLLLPVIVRAKELKAFGMVTNTNVVVVCSDEQELVETHLDSFPVLTSEIAFPFDEARRGTISGADVLADVNLANVVLVTRERRCDVVVEVGVKVFDPVGTCLSSSRIQNQAGEDA